MKTKFDYYSIGIVLVLLLLLLPLLFKKYILLFFGTTELQSYYEVISAITSGIAVIIAFISIKEQKIDSAKQNAIQNYYAEVKALTQVIEIKKFIIEHAGAESEEEILELANLTTRLHDLSMKMINVGDEKEAQRLNLIEPQKTPLNEQKPS